MAVIQSAFVEGVSTRKVDKLVQTLGLTGTDKSKVSRMCRELDEALEIFRNRPLELAYAYLWLVRDGKALGWQEMGARQAVVELVDEHPSPGTHWYVVTVEAESAFSDSPSLAQSSPFLATVRG